MTLQELTDQLTAICSGAPTIGLDPTKLKVVLRVTTEDSLDISRFGYDTEKKVFYLKAGL